MAQKSNLMINISRGLWLIFNLSYVYSVFLSFFQVVSGFFLPLSRLISWYSKGIIILNRVFSSMEIKWKFYEWATF